ncbi:MAG: hypothetical protein PHS57_01725 [Alphaproteobacteria bacterium]|nr:hypothetical protein [Alphaproteobacteria bacterium]
MHAQKDIFGKKPQPRKPSINPAVLLVLIVFFAVTGGAAIFHFMSIEYQHELLSWQNKLALVADSRVDALNGWLNRKRKALAEVADNPSLQLYVSDLVGSSEPKEEEEPAQAVFLKNLLSITADRIGFVETQSKELQSIPAGVAAPSGVGLALIDKDGRILASTAGLSVIDPAVLRRVDLVPEGKTAILDVYRTESGRARMGFVLPVFPIQADVPSPPLARLVAITDLGEDFFSLLNHPGSTDETLEAVLLRRDGDVVTYLSPRKNREGVASSLALETPDLDAAHAVKSPGVFDLKKDARSQPTLMISRTIDNTPWVLMIHVDERHAMEAARARLRQMEVILLLSLLAVIGGVVAVWYYGTSRRMLLLSLETQRVAERLASQERLLRIVADNQNASILIADEKNVARFANAKAAKTFRLTADAVVGKDLAALMGSAQAKGYVEGNGIALARRASYVRAWTLERGAGVCAVIRSEHIPLPHVPVEGLPMPTPGVLMIDQDITEVVKEREQRERILRQLADMLVTMVDRRDPYAAQHSLCVAAVARAMAVGMGLDRSRIGTAEMAGRLMNVGKISVPCSLLTKVGALTDEERQTVRRSFQSSIDLLEKIDFEGPVVETLRQAQECYDGTGPLRMKGEAILVTARIIAVANAFVGMISARSYRSAMTMDFAVKTLLEQIGTKYDRRAVVALADYVENRQGRDAIQKLLPT